MSHINICTPIMESIQRKRHHRNIMVFPAAARPAMIQNGQASISVTFLPSSNVIEQILKHLHMLRLQSYRDG